MDRSLELLTPIFHAGCKKAARKLALIAALDAVIKAPRDADQIVHRSQDLLRQRMWQSAMERGEKEPTWSFRSGTRS